MAQQVAPGPNKGMNFQNIAEKDVSTIIWMVRISNLLAAGMVMGAGIYNISTITLSVTIFITSIYVILLACLLCCFEIHLKSMDKFIYLNFGFMYYWPGRALFLLFVGSMCFGLGIFGYFGGGFMVFNILFNVYVLSVHPNYKKFVEQKTKEYQGQAMTSAANEFQVEASNMSFQDAQNAAKFYKDNKQNIEKGAKFYGENKVACDEGLKFAAANKELVGDAAKASKKAGMW